MLIKLPFSVPFRVFRVKNPNTPFSESIRVKKNEVLCVA